MTPLLRMDFQYKSGLFYFYCIHTILYDNQKQYTANSQLLIKMIKHNTLKKIQCGSVLKDKDRTLTHADQESQFILQNIK